MLNMRRGAVSTPDALLRRKAQDEDDGDALGTPAPLR